MKRSRVFKNFPAWRRQELRFFTLALIVGGMAAAVVGLLVYFTSRSGF